MARCIPERRRVAAQGGFSLLELSIVLVVIGIIVSIGATIYPNIVQTTNRQKDQAILKRAEDALVGFVVANNRMPCPDTGTDGSEDYTGDRCDSAVGNLPYVDLGLSDDRDSYHRHLRYGLYINSTDNADLGYRQISSLAHFCQILDNAQTAAATTNTPYVYVEDYAGTPNTQNQAYVLVAGGMHDVDGAGEIFDGYNEGTDTKFEYPATTGLTYGGTTTNGWAYDDQVYAGSFSALSGKLNCGAVAGQNQLSMTASALPSGTQGAIYSGAIVGANGGVPYTTSGYYLWCYEGTIPSGLSISGAGAAPSADCLAEAESNWNRADAVSVSGTVDAAATSTSFTLYVRDDVDNSETSDTPLAEVNYVSRTFTININP